ncbi:hypothetical protein MUK42_06352 [Musa troglodytarum]|uniref:Uncharacterized protein n=1 Tax=Musa troglodytarum TaxID=320322 RepID=A0A9E7GUY8_9LILI|nr:hypothetical protein MUK42_06352 [Musa troglodytarum]
MDLVKHILSDSLTDKMEVDDQRYRVLDAHVASVEDSLPCRPPAYVEEAPSAAKAWLDLYISIPFLLIPKYKARINGDSYVD